MLLAGCTRFCLEGLVDLTIGLIISLAIGGAVLVVKEVTIGLSRWFLWNELISFLRYETVEAGF